jgi:hypothetical protein
MGAGGVLSRSVCGRAEAQAATQSGTGPKEVRMRKCAPRSGWMDHFNLGKSPAFWAIFKAENTTAPRG